MGKSRKRSRHFNTGYPYSVRVAHIHVVRPKVRRQSDSSLFIGDAYLPLFDIQLSSPQWVILSDSAVSVHSPFHVRQGHQVGQPLHRTSPIGHKPAQPLQAGMLLPNAEWYTIGIRKAEPQA